MSDETMSEGGTLYRISYDDDRLDWKRAADPHGALVKFLEENPRADVHHVKPETLTGDELRAEFERHGGTWVVGRFTTDEGV